MNDLQRTRRKTQALKLTEMITSQRMITFSLLSFQSVDLSASPRPSEHKHHPKSKPEFSERTFGKGRTQLGLTKRTSYKSKSPENQRHTTKKKEHFRERKRTFSARREKNSSTPPFFDIQRDESSLSCREATK